jgi:hypothetical protein
LKINNISRSYCQQVINDWAKEMKTVNDYKIKINLVFKHAQKLGIIQQNSMKFVTIPIKQEELLYDELNEKVNFFTKDELKRFLFF